MSEKYINKKLVIIIVSIITVILISGVFHFNKLSEVNNNVNKDKVVQEEPKNNEAMLKMLSSIAGVQAKNVEIINNPVGFKGELFAPKESILNGVDYFLKNTENTKMEDVKIEIGDGFVSVFVNYKVTKNIKTSIEVKVIPSLNENEDLVININEVRFLDLKIADWIVNLALDSFAEDWFPEDFKVEYNKGNVVILKENFNGVYLKDIKVEESGLNINAIIDLEQISK